MFSFITNLFQDDSTKLAKAREAWELAKNEKDADKMSSAASRLLTLDADTEYVDALKIIANYFPDRASNSYNSLGIHYWARNENEQALKYYKASFDLDMESYGDGYHASAPGYNNTWEILERMIDDTEVKSEQLEICFRYFEICNKLAKNETTDTVIETIEENVMSLADEKSDPTAVAKYKTKLAEIKTALKSVKVIDKEPDEESDAIEELGEKYLKEEHFSFFHKITAMEFALSIDNSDVKEAIEKMMRGKSPGAEFESSSEYMGILNYLASHQDAPISEEILDEVDEIESTLLQQYGLSYNDLCSALIMSYEKNNPEQVGGHVSQEADFRKLFDILFKQLPEKSQSLQGEVPYHISLAAVNLSTDDSLRETLENLNETNSIYQGYSLKN